jgi:hypothetical protein
LLFSLNRFFLLPQLRPSDPHQASYIASFCAITLIPADAYRGVQTARALKNFQFSEIEINHYPGFIETWALVKLAAAQVNADIGAMEKESWMPSKRLVRPSLPANATINFRSFLCRSARKMLRIGCIRTLSHLTVFLHNSARYYPTRCSKLLR